MPDVVDILREGNAEIPDHRGGVAMNEWKECDPHAPNMICDLGEHGLSCSHFATRGFKVRALKVGPQGIP